MSDTSIDKISRGLAARQSRGSIFAKAGELVVSTASLEAIRSDFDQAHGRFDSTMRTITKSIAEFDTRAEARIKEFRTRPDGSVRSIEDRQRFAEEIKRDRAAHVRAVFAGLKGSLDADRLAMRTVQNAVARSADMFNPLSIASTYNLGSERRARLLEELRLMPPQALKAAAQRAVAEKDRELAGAIVSVNDALDSKRRNFSSKELADAVFSEMSTTALAHCGHVARTCDAALAAERNLESGKTDSLGRIERALAARDAA
jgi:hypothetical protein